MMKERREVWPDGFGSAGEARVENGGRGSFTGEYLGKAMAAGWGEDGARAGRCRAAEP